VREEKKWEPPNKWHESQSVTINIYNINWPDCFTLRHYVLLCCSMVKLCLMNCSKAQRVKDAGGHIRLAGGKRAGSTDGAHGAGISERLWRVRWCGVRPELSVMLFLDIRALRNPDLFSPNIPISCGSFLQSFVGAVARSVAGFSLRVG
jgi:hypothetical protein